VADSLLQITVALHEVPADVSARALETSGNMHSRNGLARLVRELGGLVAKDHKVLARVDSVTRGSASLTVTVESDDTTAGDKLYIQPYAGGPRIALTAVATAAEVTAAPKTGLWSLATATDTAKAQSLRDAINAHQGLNGYMVATESSGVVTLTFNPGTWAHSAKVTKAVTTANALSISAASPTGGDDILQKPSIAVTFGSANIAADDTISIGARKYTWKASASADGEITLSTTEATAATNFADAINADATWTGLITAIAADAVVTLTWEGDPRVGQHIVMDFAETNSGSVSLGGTAVIGTGEAFVLGTTVTGSSTARTFGGRGAA
jgi:hypothetical protein